MKLETTLGSLVLGLMMIAMPAAVAFHGAEYDAYGQAVGPDATIYNVHVHWGGYAGPVFTVDITTLDTNTVVVHSSFLGVWWARGPGVPGGEVLLYKAASADPLILFQIQGIVYNTFNPCHQHMLYVGNYQLYQLVLTVDEGCPF
jgi:hypothetical protein